MDLNALKQYSLEELEDLYAQTSQEEIPSGSYRGHHLARLDAPRARKPYFSVSWPFSFVPFGIDFDSHNWFFLHPRLQVGHFRMAQEKSRWRDTQSLALHYDESGLPGFVKGILYDEIKPLTPELCLGIGGINRETGAGDHFFFALTKTP